MSARILSSLTDEKRDGQKQIGCTYGIFQLFHRHHFLTGRHSSSHNQKRLLLGAQHQLEPHNATKAVIEKDLEVQKEKPRVSMESSRASYSSSSCSSTFSSLDHNRTAQPETLSLRQINYFDSPFQITAMKEQQPSLPKGPQSPGLRDVVKDSIYREAHGLSIKSLANDQRQGHAMKHIDSPRPLQQSKLGKPKATGYEGSTRVLAKVQEGTTNSKDERMTPPRFSYDGRESRDTFKTSMKLKATGYEGSTRVLAKVHEGTANSKDERMAPPRFSCDGRESRDTFKTRMKLKEIPRLSLDSKASSIKCSALESRLNFLGRELHMENDNSSEVLPLNQEPGSHTRSSSIVAKLMGLDAFPDTISGEESRPTKTESSPSPKVAFLSKSSTTAENSKKNEGPYFQTVSQNNPASSPPRLHNVNSVRKPCSRLPMEPAPWRQQDSSQGSPRMAPRSTKAPTKSPHLSSSVYGEIENRITELEFQRSGKDLRALKQILEAMQKTRESLENQRRETADLTAQRRCCLEDSCSDQNSNLSMRQNRKTYPQVSTIKGPFPPKPLGSSIGITKSAKVMGKVKNSSSTQVPSMEIPHLRRLQTQDHKYHMGNSAHRKETKDLTPRNNNLKKISKHLPSIGKKTNWRNSELQRTLRAPEHMKGESCTTSGRSFGMVSPRLQKKIPRIGGQSHPNTPSSDSGRVKKHSSKKVIEQCSQNRKHKVKSKDFHLSEDQLSELSSETRHSSYQGDTASVKSESNNGEASQIETVVISLTHSISTNSRERQACKNTNSVSTTRAHMPAPELAVTIMEQPSPVSVLDATFYSEDLPSPVKKISTAFRDEGPSPDEAQWHLENLNHLTDCTRSGPGYRNNQKLENMLHLVHKPILLNTEPYETAANHNASAYRSLNPDQRYINKILLTSGLLKDTSIIPTADQLFSSCHLINPNMFHTLDETEDTMEEADRELVEKDDQMKLNHTIERKIVFDMVNEILARKITSGGLFKLGRKRLSPQGLMKEAYVEMDHLRRMPHCNLDGEDNGLIRLLSADMKYQSEHWTDYSSEVPGLVLDIERRIFKDLINEVVTGEVIDLHDGQKRHCTQLFTK